jgi:glycosyltransferase involved in cell wall biosynthesis
MARANEPGALRFVFVGNLIPRKGLHTLLDALARLPSNMWQLAVVGNPNIDLEYTRVIRKKILELRLMNVQLVGTLPDAELANVLAHSHVMVVPSQYEGFGIVYLEGMNFGLPAIATTAGGASEIVCNGKNGFLVPPDDIGVLATRLDHLLRDRNLLARMSLAARRRFLDHPTWDESMTRIRQNLKEMIR